MENLNALGKPCPIPVIEAKKILAKGTDVSVLVDNFVAVQNLEKMANGYGFSFSYIEKEKNVFEAAINLNGKKPPVLQKNIKSSEPAGFDAKNVSTAVVIGKNFMGSGNEELSRILIKGFIYSLTELPSPPNYVIFLNSGAFLTSQGSNTVDDIKKLEQLGSKIYTCGTCANFYGIAEKLAVGSIVNMYQIVECMNNSAKVINI